MGTCCAELTAHPAPTRRQSWSHTCRGCLVPTPSPCPLRGALEVVTVGDRDLQLSALSSQALAPLQPEFSFPSRGGGFGRPFSQTPLSMPGPAPFKLKSQESHSLVPICTLCGLLFLPCQEVKEGGQPHSKGMTGTQKWPPTVT